ncbi:MAG TPA: class III extradiol ring-cleavage dioxygenase [Acetobacteraceae bacterium]|nr:class III extradiol ring-cleavage dioxygenase [Acetobacteraceae bacterium]
MQPSLFVSHGSPMLALDDSPARRFLAGLGDTLPRPRAVLVVSAHWETAQPRANAVARNDTIHDFYGFPLPLYALRYPAPGDAALAERVTDLLCAAGLASGIDHRRGLDHGAWVPLSLIYPAADVPVVQLSVQSRLGPAHHLQLGRALAALREEEVLVLGSGSFTHDLSRFRGQPLDAPAAPDAVAFADWMDAALTEGRVGDLLAYRRLAPHAAANHPTEEHLLPLFVALGAAGCAGRGVRLHASSEYGILRMDAYAFE